LARSFHVLFDLRGPPFRRYAQEALWDGVDMRTVVDTMILLGAFATAPVVSAKELIVWQLFPDRTIRKST